MSKTTEEFLTEIAESKILVVIEGKNDIIALNRYNVTNTYELGKTSVELCAEEIANILDINNTNECVILTDFDVEGKKLKGKLYSYLPRLGINVRKDLRTQFRKITRLVCIEGLQ